jgi:hypothetical protein
MLRTTITRRGDNLRHFVTLFVPSVVTV